LRLKPITATQTQWSLANIIADVITDIAVFISLIKTYSLTDNVACVCKINR